MSPQEEGPRCEKDIHRKASAWGRHGSRPTPWLRPLSPMEMPMAFPSLHLAGADKEKTSGILGLLIKR